MSAPTFRTFFVAPAFAAFVMPVSRVAASPQWRPVIGMLIGAGLPAGLASP
ncbi:hypothetical protein [Actinoplanes sp. NPDC026670]|uniref:hypothetical protein n=1 Tax=Actinoplanes sp. NPDC026670 TaxID=3154700 RepID=UPI0033CF331E